MKRKRKRMQVHAQYIHTVQEITNERCSSKNV
jgi:hypothetical protein